MTPQTISNCFRRVQILPEAVEDEDDMVLRELRQLLVSVQHADEATPTLSADKYVDCDNEAETGQTLTDDDIMSLVTQEEEKDEEEQEETPIPTRIQAREKIKDLIRYFEYVGDKDNLEAVLNFHQSILRIQPSKQSTLVDFFGK